MPVTPFPSTHAYFDQNGTLVAGSTFDPTALGVVTDLIVISHGWNNDNAEAAALYDAFFASVDALRDAGMIIVPPERTFNVLRIFWPSKKFDLPQSAGGGGAAAAVDLNLEQVTLQIERLIQAYPDKSAQRDALEKAQNLVPQLSDTPGSADEFVRLVLSTSTIDLEEKDSISKVFTQTGDMSGTIILQALSVAATPPPAIDSAAAEVDPTAGGAAFGVQNILGGAINFLNLFTYKTMKERAGIVGVNGVAPLVAKTRAQFPKLRIHLIGHSFGGRLVTSVANAFPGGDWGHQVSSMMLLQAAFSQFGFSKDYLNTGRDGAFRDVMTKSTVAGEIAITHTTNDKAVGIAYPLASRLFNQVASALGDAHDLYGGIGTNGAQDTPEALQDTLAAEGSNYLALPAGRKIRNLVADKYIADHGNVTGLQTAFVMMRNAVMSPAP